VTSSAFYWIEYRWQWTLLSVRNQLTSITSPITSISPHLIPRSPPIFKLEIQDIYVRLCLCTSPSKVDTLKAQVLTNSICPSGNRLTHKHCSMPLRSSSLYSDILYDDCLSKTSRPSCTCNRPSVFCCYASYRIGPRRTTSPPSIWFRQTWTILTALANLSQYFRLGFA
jgi:hypothetical protein